MIVELRKYLTTSLQADVDFLMPKAPSGATQILAQRRLQAVVDRSPLMLVWLSEPWHHQNKLDEFLLHCARVHLYARVLDDAIDENLPIHRLNLLRYQPQFWSSVGQLAQHYPARWAECTALISETVAAVEQDDQDMMPELWGKKNHHLLLIPLLLSETDALWIEYKSALSNFIWLMQTGEEWQQGELKKSKIIRDVLVKIERILSNEEPQKLFEYGWRSVSERMLWDCKNLLAVLS